MTRPINLFEYEAIAKQHLKPMALDYYQSGAWDEITLRENRLAHIPQKNFDSQPINLLDIISKLCQTSIARHF